MTEWSRILANRVLLIKDGNLLLEGKPGEVFYNKDLVISLEFTYGVIDKCVLKAINKKNTLILSSGGMYTRVHTRVEAFNLEYDQSIRVIENF